MSDILLPVGPWGSAERASTIGSWVSIRMIDGEMLWVFDTLFVAL